MTRRVPQSLSEFFATSRITRADAARAWGVSQATISRWCRGHRIPKGAMALRIARETRIPIARLLSGGTVAGMIALLLVSCAVPTAPDPLDLLRASIPASHPLCNVAPLPLGLHELQRVSVRDPRFVDARVEGQAFSTLFPDGGWLVWFDRADGRQVLALFLPVGPVFGLCFWSDLN